MEGPSSCEPQPGCWPEAPPPAQQGDRVVLKPPEGSTTVNGRTCWLCPLPNKTGALPSATPIPNQGPRTAEDELCRRAVKAPARCPQGPCARAGPEELSLGLPTPRRPLCTAASRTANPRHLVCPDTRDLTPGPAGPVCLSPHRWVGHGRKEGLPPTSPTAHPRLGSQKRRQMNPSKPHIKYVQFSDTREPHTEP